MIRRPPRSTRVRSSAASDVYKRQRLRRPLRRRRALRQPHVSRIVLGVSGGIAAYKACEVLRRLTEDGHDVTVVPTENALRFVGETTFAALSGKPVATDVFTSADRIPHVRLGREADLVLVAPATADLISRGRGNEDEVGLTAQSYVRDAVRAGEHVCRHRLSGQRGERRLPHETQRVLGGHDRDVMTILGQPPKDLAGFVRG